MNKKRTIIVLALVAASSVLFASGTESDKLWFHADNTTDTSVSFLPGTRTIDMQNLDGDGKIVETSHATVRQVPTNYGRYLEQRVYGDRSIPEILGYFFDGGVLTPFEDNLFDMDYTPTGTETIDGRTCTVYEVKMAFDRALPTYDPNYQASGEIMGWDFDTDDFDGTINATVWVDQETASLVKLVNTWTLGDIVPSGHLEIVQTVDYKPSIVDDTEVNLPSLITTTGRLTRFSAGSGYREVTDFIITETQGDFFRDMEFVRGESVD